MKTQVVRFTGGADSTLEILLTPGKRGLNLRAKVKAPNTKTQTGCRAVFADEAQAVARFAALGAEATKRGWALKVGRSTFSEIPAAPAAKGKK
jgi:hypothetical protein